MLFIYLFFSFLFHIVLRLLNIATLRASSERLSELVTCVEAVTVSGPFWVVASERVSSALSADAQIAPGPWADSGYSVKLLIRNMDLIILFTLRVPTSSPAVCLYSSLLVCCV